MLIGFFATPQGGLAVSRDCATRRNPPIARKAADYAFG
jgi:hypothetical protein